MWCGQKIKQPHSSKLLKNNNNLKFLNKRGSTQRRGSRAESLWWANGGREASRKEWLKVADSMERADPETGGKDIGGWRGDDVIILEGAKTLLSQTEELVGKWGQQGHWRAMSSTSWVRKGGRFRLVAGGTGRSKGRIFFFLMESGLESTAFDGKHCLPDEAFSVLPSRSVNQNICFLK